MMKIVIDIPKKLFDEIQKNNFINVGQAYAKKVIAYIKKGTPLEQEPKTGHWIKDNLPLDLYRCSECGELSCCKGHFCSECGAKMVESEVGE